MTHEPSTPPAQGAGIAPPFGVGLPDTLWAQVGGTETFERLVRNFYGRVQQDEVLAPMYPQQDWEGAIWRLRAFLEQYWGGPTSYSEERGHPRLRLRHQPYQINRDAKERWLTHMNAALDEVGLPLMHDAAFREYVDRAAASLVNQPG